MNSQNKKPWWLKRWMLNSIEWCDSKMFSQYAETTYPSAGVPVYMALMACMAAIILMAVLSLFVSNDNAQTMGNWVLGIVIACCLGNSIWYLVQTHKAFPSVKIKIFRAIFVIFATVCVMMLGAFLGNVIVFVVLGLIVLYVFLYFLGGGSSSKDPDTFKLDDGTIVKREKGLLGEVTYRGNDGHTYERDGNTFRRIF